MGSVEKLEKALEDAKAAFHAILALVNLQDAKGVIKKRRVY